MSSLYPFITLLLCVALGAYSCLVRGGHMGGAGNTEQRVISGVLVIPMGFALHTSFVVIDPVPAAMYGFALAVSWVAFYWLGWGAWFDLGTKPPEPNRGSQPMKWVYGVVAKQYGDYWGDFAALAVRGALVIGVFIVAAYPFPASLKAVTLVISATAIYVVVFLTAYHLAHRTTIGTDTTADTLIGAAHGALLFLLTLTLSEGY